MFVLNDDEQDTFKLNLVINLCVKLSAKTRQESVSVTGLNLEHARALLPDQVNRSAKRTVKKSS
jgi:hypothetical protein